MLIRYSLIISAVLMLAGCSSTPKDSDSFFRDRDYDYRFAKETPRTQTPKDLTDDYFIDLYPVPGLRTADAQYIDGLTMPPAQVVADQSKVRLKKLNNDEWLLVRSSPSQLWPLLKEFILNEKLTITAEKGALGILNTRNISGDYHFELRQGFQRKTSELTLRYVPKKSQNKQQINDFEISFLQKMGRYFSEMLDKPSYSYVARGISTKKRMQLISDDLVGNAILLDVKPTRAVASVKKALSSAAFRIDHIDQDSTGNTMIDVTYYPTLSEKPGFIARLFGAKADGFDDSQPYAGRQYKVWVTNESPDDNQKVYFKSPSADQNLSGNESRDMTILLKRHLV